MNTDSNNLKSQEINQSDPENSDNYNNENINGELFSEKRQSLDSNRTLNSSNDKSENRKENTRQSISTVHSADGEDIFSRGIAFLEAKAKRISELEIQQLEENAKNLTFHPEISKRAHELHAVRTGPYYDFSEQWKEKVNANIEQKKKQLVEEETNKIVGNKKGLSKKSKYIIEKNLKQNKYKNPIEGWNERFEQFQKHRMEQSKINSEFKPQINKKSENLKRQGTVYQRLHGEAESKEKRLLSTREKIRHKEMFDPSTGQELFKPKINYSNSHRDILNSTIYNKQSTEYIKENGKYFDDIKNFNSTTNQFHDIKSYQNNDSLHWSLRSPIPIHSPSLTNTNSQKSLLRSNTANLPITPYNHDAAMQIENFLERRKWQEQLKQDRLNWLMERKIKGESNNYSPSNEMYNRVKELRDARRQKIQDLKGITNSTNHSTSKEENLYTTDRTYHPYDFDTNSYTASISGSYFDTNESQVSLHSKEDKYPNYSKFNDYQNILNNRNGQLFHQGNTINQNDNNRNNNPNYFNIEKVTNFNESDDENLREYVGNKVKNAWEKLVSENRNKNAPEFKSFNSSSSDSDEDSFLHEAKVYKKDVTDQILDTINSDLEIALSDWESLMEIPTKRKTV